MAIASNTHRKEKTHSHLSNNPLSVLTNLISGSPSSVTLKSISLTPFHISQFSGVTSEDGSVSHFDVGFNVNTKLRNDSENDFENVVILMFALHPPKKGK